MHCALLFFSYGKSGKITKIMTFWQGHSWEKLTHRVRVVPVRVRVHPAVQSTTGTPSNHPLYKDNLPERSSLNPKKEKFWNSIIYKFIKIGNIAHEKISNLTNRLARLTFVDDSNVCEFFLVKLVKLERTYKYRRMTCNKKTGNKVVWKVWKTGGLSLYETGIFDNLRIWHGKQTKQRNALEIQKMLRNV